MVEHMQPMNNEVRRDASPLEWSGAFLAGCQHEHPPGCRSIPALDATPASNVSPA